MFGLDSAFSPQIAQRHNVAAWPRSEKLAWLLSTNLAVKQVLRRLLPDHLNDIIKQTILRFNETKFILPPMKPETRVQLVNYFRPFNDQLSDLLGRDVSHWNIV